MAGGGIPSSFMQAAKISKLPQETGRVCGQWEGTVVPLPPGPGLGEDCSGATPGTAAHLLFI